jgi:hypothetical protein
MAAARTVAVVATFLAAWLSGEQHLGHLARHVPLKSPIGGASEAVFGLREVSSSLLHHRGTRAPRRGARSVVNLLEGVVQ